MSDADLVIDEPVRGAIGDLRAIQHPGVEGARLYVHGELPGPPVSRLLGLRPTDSGLGKSTYSMPITRWLEGPFGLVWGGTFALLADAPLGVSIWTALGPGKMVTTSELNLNFVRPFTRDTGNIVAAAGTIHVGRQVGLSQVQITDREGRVMGQGSTRCLIVDVPVDPGAEFPEPDLGPSDSPDPYLREAPHDAYFDLETILNGNPPEIQKRIIAGEVTPNATRLSGAVWSANGPGSVTGVFPTSPWFSAGGPNLYGGVIAWMAEAVMASSVYSTLGPGEVFGTLDLNVRFTRPAPINSGELTIVGEVQHMGRRVRIASAEVVSAAGKRVAMASSSVLIVPGGIRALMRGTIPEEIAHA
ncbi:MAG: PaaI family thioesterase [Acidimicrobiia bacterium]|nr:PaaI family thioesterase [Acidimicrobiia bacterium]